MTPIERVRYALDLLAEEAQFHQFGDVIVSLSYSASRYFYPSLSFIAPPSEAGDKGFASLYDDDPLLDYDENDPIAGSFEDGIKRLEEMINEHRTRHDST